VVFKFAWFTNPPVSTSAKVAAENKIRLGRESNEKQICEIFLNTRPNGGGPPPHESAVVQLESLLPSCNQIGKPDTHFTPTCTGNSKSPEDEALFQTTRRRRG